MTRCEHAVIACLLLWLVVYVESFCSERPYDAPLTRRDNASSHPPNVHHCLPCADVATLTRDDVTHQSNPAVMVFSLVQILSVVVMARLAVCILLMALKIDGKKQRHTIQVLVSGCGRTMVVNVHADSLGKTLYSKVQRMNGIPVSLLTLVHGTSVVRHSFFVGRQGIHHLSTVFVFALGRGGGKARLAEEPGLPELIALQGRHTCINIAEQIGTKWELVGITLLQDRSGSIVSAINEQYRGDVLKINTEILKRWVSGQGLQDRTWHGLLSVLKVHSRALAKSVEEALTSDETTDPPPTDQPDPPYKLPHLCPPLEPQSAVWHFNAYLKSIYNRSSDPVDTWPPSPSEKFINLAVITREKVDSKNYHAFMLASLHGDVDEILEIKAPVTIEKLLDISAEKKLESVLIEGAPGVGKSTFSWEICKRWAEGILFQQFSLVLLLRLRDETVQNARTIKDLILYTVEERLENISQYLKDTRGQHTLLILEGLDELPKYLLTQSSIFTHLLDGTELPDAVILVTSRPSATPHLWKNWKKRISKHVEILGFTDENIKDYVASILDPEEIPAFYTYLCMVPSIRQLMYIPLHSGIAIELYRMFSGSNRPLPTTKTDLYTALVQTILTRYLAKHPKYKDENLDVEEFTDLPSDVYPVFMELTQLAFDSLSRQQLIFKDKEKPIQHLGFMDVVTELFPFKRRIHYSYNFLHLSLQEYLAAVHVSLLDISTQERLLASLSTEQHLKNMGMFLAAITHFKGMDSEVVKLAIQSECREWADGSESLVLSNYVIQLVYEAKDVTLLEGHPHFTYQLKDYSPLVDFTALGYCIANSSYKWSLELGNEKQHMQSTQGIDQLVQALGHNTSPNFTIHSITCYYKETEIPQQLLTALPQHALQSIESLVLISKAPQPLPVSLPQLVHKMNRLHTLWIDRATVDTLTKVLHSITTDSLEQLCLVRSDFTLAAMQACCRALVRNMNTIAKLNFNRCGISDELALCLAEALPSLNNLTGLWLAHNAIGDEGRAAIEKCKQINKQVDLYY